MFKQSISFIFLLSLASGIVSMETTRSKQEYQLMRSCSCSAYVEDRKQLKEEKVKKLLEAGVNVNTQNPPEYGCFPLKEVLEAHATYTSYIAIAQRSSQPDPEWIKRCTEKQKTAENILRLLLNTRGINLNLRWMSIHPLKLYTNSWQDSSKTIDPAIVTLLLSHTTSDGYSISKSVIEELIADRRTIRTVIPALQQALNDRN